MVRTCHELSSWCFPIHLRRHQLLDYASISAPWVRSISIISSDPFSTATWSATSPKAFLQLTSIDASKSSLAMDPLSQRIAWNRAVCPIESCTLGSTLLSSKIFTTPSWPLSTARCSAVCPLPSCFWASAPCARRSRVTDSCRAQTARWSEVRFRRIDCFAFVRLPKEPNAPPWMVVGDDYQTRRSAYLDRMYSSLEEPASRTASRRGGKGNRKWLFTWSHLCTEKLLVKLCYYLVFFQSTTLRYVRNVEIEHGWIWVEIFFQWG